MDTIPALVVVGAVVAALLLAFKLGYDSASRRERHAKRAAQRQVHHIGQWVREHWPDEHKAYSDGWKQGYQAGILHGADADAEAERLKDETAS